MNPAIPSAQTPVTELKFSISGGRCAFLAGEKISFRITASESSHIAILSHQSDGRRLVLFPNIWEDDSHITAGTTVEIPRPGSGFELESGPPFGTDLVEAIAFDSKENLESLLQELEDSAGSSISGPRSDPVDAFAPSGRASILVGSFPANGNGVQRPACIDSAPSGGSRIHGHSHAIDI